MHTLRPNTRWLAGTLLVLMLAMLTPKDFYHYCEHPVGKTVKGEVSLSSDPACAVCSFQLLPYHFVPKALDVEENDRPPIYGALPARHCSKTMLRHFCPRGPPSFLLV